MASSECHLIGLFAGGRLAAWAALRAQLSLRGLILIGASPGSVTRMNALREALGCLESQSASRKAEGVLVE